MSSKIQPCAAIATERSSLPIISRCPSFLILFLTRSLYHTQMQGMRHREKLEIWSFRNSYCRGQSTGRQQGRGSVGWYHKKNKYSTGHISLLPSLSLFRDLDICKTNMLKVEIISSQYLLPECLKVTDEIMNKKRLKSQTEKFSLKTSLQIKILRSKGFSP